jgi:hypothetical protein
MGNLYLDSGESIIQTTDRISVNAVASELLLTNRRLILVDSTHRGVDPLMIPFATIVSLQGGWNLIGEPVITLTLTDPEEGRTEFLDLVFYQQSGEHRKAECDAWAQYLMDHIVLARQDTIRIDVPPSAPKPGLHPSVRRWVAPDMIHPHTTVTPARPIPAGDMMTPPSGAGGVVNDETQAQSPSTPPGDEECIVLKVADTPAIQDSDIQAARFVPVPEIPETPTHPPDDRGGEAPIAGIPIIVPSIVQESPVTFPVPFPVLHTEMQPREPPVSSTEGTEPVSRDTDNSQLTEIPTRIPITETPASHEMFPIPFPLLHTEMQLPEFPVIPTKIPEPNFTCTITSPPIVIPEPDTPVTAAEPEPVSPVTLTSPLPNIPESPPAVPESQPVSPESITPPPVSTVAEISMLVQEPEPVSSVTLTSPFPAIMESPPAVPESKPIPPEIITPPPVSTMAETSIPVQEPEPVSSVTLTSPLPAIMESPPAVPESKPIPPEIIMPPLTVTPIMETSMPVQKPEPVSSVTLTSPLTDIPESPPAVTPITETSMPVQEPASPEPIHQSEPPVVADPCAPVHKTVPPTPQKPPVPAKPPILTIVLILLIIAGGTLLYVSMSGWNTGAHQPGITPAPTLSPIPSQPVIVIPENGIWVHVRSNSTFVGSYGNPGSLQLVSGSGSEFYRIQDPASLVQATFQKQAYTGDPLTINIYRNGTLITHRTITAPRGTIDLIIDAKTGNSPGLPTTLPV